VKKRANPSAPSSAPTAAATKKSAAVIPGSSKPSKGVAQPSTLDTFKYKHTPEDSELLATELIPTSFLTGLADSNWKARLAALEEMITWIESMIEELDAEVIVRALAKRCWNEKNFQVSSTFLVDVTVSLLFASFQPVTFCRYQPKCTEY
jgi:cytoskeleton-associated protein 5